MARKGSAAFHSARIPGRKFFGRPPKFSLLSLLVAAGVAKGPMTRTNRTWIASLLTAYLLISGAIFCAAPSRPALASPTPDSPKPLSPKDRQEVFENVWKGVHDRYYDPEFHGVNWEEVGKRYRVQVDGVKDDAEFYALLNKMTGELHDAHTRFNSPSQWENRQKNQGVSIGFTMSELDGKVVVTDVIPNSNASAAGIEPGMIVLTVDGQPIADKIAESARTVIPSSTERITRVRVVAGVFKGPADTSYKIGLQRADASTLEVTIAKQLIPRPPDVTSRALPSGEAYIRFDGFQIPVEKEFMEALEKFKDAPGLIIDLRFNGGGRGDVLKTLAGYLYDQKTLFAQYMTRKDISSEEKTGSIKGHREMNAGKDGGQIYSGPLVLLTTTGTASSSEMFAGGLQETGRAKVVGSQTCGCVIGIANNQKMKGGGVLEVSEVLFFTPKGRKLEGDGVTPDIPVVPSIADLQQRRDVVLDRAEQLLKNMPSAKSVSANQ
jgi:carboxyl-terminal processing protease